MPAATDSLDIFRTPFTVVAPGRQTLALVFASPHSGAAYPPDFVAAAKLDPLMLRRSEDAFVDELFAGVVGLGAPLIKAHFPRAYIDPNREPFELDPAMFEDTLPDYVNVRSPRVAGGLGTIAKIVASGAEIYRGKLRFAEARERIETLWKPYHAGLAGLVEETRQRFGRALLIDCHSMPSVGGPLDRDAGRQRVDFVLGNCHGASCVPRAMQAAEGCLKDLGYAVARNEPYAGGYTTRHYGRPARAEHALQIEINRALYMDEIRITRKPFFEALAADMCRLARVLGEAAKEMRPA